MYTLSDISLWPYIKVTDVTELLSFAHTLYNNYVPHRPGFGVTLDKTDLERPYSRPAEAVCIIVVFLGVYMCACLHFVHTLYDTVLVLLRDIYTIFTSLTPPLQVKQQCEANRVGKCDIMQNNNNV